MADFGANSSSKEEYLKLAAKHTAELVAAKKEYDVAQARLKKTIEAYKKPSSEKKNNGVFYANNFSFANFPPTAASAGQSSQSSNNVVYTLRKSVWCLRSP